MSWKDFLYYQRSEQLAIILLLVLIFIGLITNFIFASRAPSQVVINYNDSLVAAFDSFYNSIEVEKKNVSYTTSSKSFSAEKDIAASNPHVKINIKDCTSSVNNYKPNIKLKIGETIYLNNSDTSAWKKLPGIGSSYASRIVKYRDLLGGYASIDQLKEVYGMDEDRYQNIIPYVDLDIDISKININKLEFKELLKHPYLNYKQVQAINNLRRKKGDIKSLNELSVLIEFSEDDLTRLNPYLEF